MGGLEHKLSDNLKDNNNFNDSSENKLTQCTKSVKEANSMPLLLEKRLKASLLIL